MTYLCIEILGENSFHKFLIQSGWSGKDYHFTFNPATGSHLRAYRRMEDYYAERVDLHRTADVWALVANLLPEDQIAPEAFVGTEAPASATPEAAPDRASRTRKPR